jgi:putative hydrolase of the HAD superfamily
MTIEIVFFDAGETLVHPHPSFPELFSQIVTEEGHPVDSSTVAEVQQRLAPHLVDLAEDTGVTAPSLDPDDSRKFWTFLYKRLLRELEIDADESVSNALYERFSDVSSYALFDDVEDSLKAVADAGYRLGLVSNFEGWLDEMLVELEVGDVFEVKVISGLVGVEKPDPRIYEIALEQAKVDASAAAHVGDSPGLDIEPSMSLGISPILLDRFNRYPDHDVTRVQSLREVTEVLPKL